VAQGIGRSLGSVHQSVTLVSCAKMAEPIEMPFGLRTQVGPGNQFWDAICYTLLCLNDSDYVIGYGRGLSGRPTECRYCPITCN